MFPVMIGAAGSRPGIPAGHGVALVAWLVRIGLIFAPAMVGAAADAWGLAAALAIPLVAGVAIVAAAPALTGGSLRRDASQSRASAGARWVAVAGSWRSRRVRIVAGPAARGQSHHQRCYCEPIRPSRPPSRDGGRSSRVVMHGAQLARWRLHAHSGPG